MGFVYGVGINDGKYPTRINGVRTPQYSKWRLLLLRCFDEKYKAKYPSYMGCTMSDEFKYYSIFYEWYNENLIGNNHDFHLDKDLLFKNNKVYSKDTCVFIPREINNTFIKRKSCRGEFPIGVAKLKNKFLSQLGYGNDILHLGIFDNPYDAFIAYKLKKEKIIADLANKYKNVIDIRAYQALINYSVDITD